MQTQSSFNINFSFLRTGEVVAQFKYTVLIMPNGVNLVTGVAFLPEQYESEHSITDTELKVSFVFINFQNSNLFF